jgi:hypothetical protein
MPPASFAKQHCGRDRLARACSFQECFFLGTVQPLLGGVEHVPSSVFMHCLKFMPAAAAVVA